MTGDRRQSPRFAVDIQARVRLEDETCQARTRDLSLSGMCFVAASPIPVGAVIQIEAALQFGTNAFSEELPLVARVVWCTRVPEGHQVGCAFTNMNARTVEYLELFLRYLRGEIDVEGVPTDEGESDDQGVM